MSRVKGQYMTGPGRQNLHEEAFGHGPEPRDRSSTEKWIHETWRLNHRVGPRGEQAGYWLGVIAVNGGDFHAVVKEDGAVVMSLSGKVDWEKAKEVFSRAVILDDLIATIDESFHGSFQETAEREDDDPPPAGT